MKAVSLLISSTSAGPELLLKTLRVLPSDAEIFRLVSIGDLEGIKTVFSNGQASVNDIDDQRWSLLHVCPKALPELNVQVNNSLEILFGRTRRSGPVSS